MNVLYFDHNELWSPEIDDLDDLMIDNMNGMEEVRSISKIQQKQGKYINMRVSPCWDVGIKVGFTVGEE